MGTGLLCTVANDHSHYTRVRHHWIRTYTTLYVVYRCAFSDKQEDMCRRTLAVAVHFAGTTEQRRSSRPFRVSSTCKRLFEFPFSPRVHMSLCWHSFDYLSSLCARCRTSIANRILIGRRSLIIYTNNRRNTANATFSPACTTRGRLFAPPSFKR